jgi:hypothetical protein
MIRKNASEGDRCFFPRPVALPFAYQGKPSDWNCVPIEEYLRVPNDAGDFVGSKVADMDPQRDIRGSCSPSSNSFMKDEQSR